MDHSLQMLLVLLVRFFTQAAYAQDCITTPCPPHLTVQSYTSSVCSIASIPYAWWHHCEMHQAANNHNHVTGPQPCTPALPTSRYDGKTLHKQRMHHYTIAQPGPAHQSYVATPMSHTGLDTELHTTQAAHAPLLL